MMRIELLLEPFDHELVEMLRLAPLLPIEDIKATFHNPLLIKLGLQPQYRPTKPP